MFVRVILDGVRIGVDVHVGMCDFLGVSLSTDSGSWASAVFIFIPSILSPDSDSLSEVPLSELLPEVDEDDDDDPDDEVVLVSVLVSERFACPL